MTKNCSCGGHESWVAVFAFAGLAACGNDGAMGAGGVLAANGGMSAAPAVSVPMAAAAASGNGAAVRGAAGMHAMTPVPAAGSGIVTTTPPSRAGSGAVSSEFPMQTAGVPAMMMSSAGSGGQAMAGASAAGAGGSGGAAGGAPGDDSDPCAGGKVEEDSSMAHAGNEYAAVKYTAPSGNEIVDFKMVLAVPKKPAMQGVLFIWPGLQSLGRRDPARLGNGILQPVLTWGSSCAPSLPSDLSNWWISGMYVNVSTNAAGPTGCAGGRSMSVNVGDMLAIDIVLDGTNWTQVVTDQKTNAKVDFTIDLKNQEQDWATWAIEEPQGSNVKPAEDVVFTKSVLTFKMPVMSCQPSQRGPNDYYSAPRMSADGLRCCYDKVVLRAQGVPASTMN